MEIKVGLMWPPSVNHEWVKARGRIILAPKGRTYRAYVAGKILAMRAHGVLPKAPLAGDLAMTMELYPPDRRRRDVDNYSKAVLDALTHARLWRDDSQIKRQTVEVCEPRAGGQVVLSISGLEEDER